jgi:transposase
MQYCGLDLGKKSSHFCVVDGNRRVIEEGQVRNRVDKLTATFSELPPMRIALEASSKAFWIADRLRDLGHEPVVVDPGRTKAIGAAKIKHDKLDARVLAQLCATGLLAEVDQPTEELRLARMPVVARDGLVRCRKILINQVRSLLDSEGIEVRKCSPDAFIDRVADVWDELPVEMAHAVEPTLDAIHELTEQIGVCDTKLKESVAKDPDAKLLMTAPGVGPVVASYFLMAVRDPLRFRSGRSVGAYLGLVPSLYQSGETLRRGTITKRGNRQARWALSIAANVILGPSVRKPSAIRQWGLRLVGRLGRKKAVIAVARKLASVLWAMWRNRAAFEARLAEAA